MQKFTVSACVITFILSGLTLSGCTQGNQEQETSQTKQLTNQTQQMKETAEKKTDQLAAPVKGDKVAIIETEYGDIKIKLFTKEAPEMTKNFEELTKSEKFNGTPFHRVIKDFMIQTGDFTTQDGFGGYSYKGEGTELPDEIVPELKHLYGTASMANHGPDTNGSQFFIVTNKNGTSFLDGKYTIFGQVYEGMDIAEKIQDLQIPGTEKTKEKVTMKKVTVKTF